MHSYYSIIDDIPCAGYSIPVTLLSPPICTSQPFTSVPGPRPPPPLLLDPALQGLAACPCRTWSLGVLLPPGSSRPFVPRGGGKRARWVHRAGCVPARGRGKDAASTVGTPDCVGLGEPVPVIVFQGTGFSCELVVALFLCPRPLKLRRRLLSPRPAGQWREALCWVPGGLLVLG